MNMSPKFVKFFKILFIFAALAPISSVLTLVYFLSQPIVKYPFQDLTGKIPSNMFFDKQSIAIFLASWSYLLANVTTMVITISTLNKANWKIVLGFLLPAGLFVATSCGFGYSLYPITLPGFALFFSFFGLPALIFLYFLYRR
jgi:hypothetical protein